MTQVEFTLTREIRDCLLKFYNYRFYWLFVWSTYSNGDHKLV
jgi:hypothetical protein